jgi:hypothetical protein
MPLSLESPRVVALAAELEALGVVWSPTIVDVDDERLNVLARGARCVSFSSAALVRGTVSRRTGGIRTLGELPRHGCGSSAVGRCRKNRADSERVEPSGKATRGTPRAEMVLGMQREVYGEGEQAGRRYRERLVAMFPTSECPRSSSMLRCSG